MASKRNTISDRNPKPGSKHKTRSRVRPQKVLAEADLARRVIQVLEEHSEHGLTCGELCRKCRSDWRRGLARKLLIKRAEAGLKDVQSFVYDLWARGLVFSQPPGRNKTASRFWSMEVARAKFPLACPPSLVHQPSNHSFSKELLKSAYEKFVPQHLGGFVPIFKVRRELVVSREDFDGLLRSLNERDDPVLELLGGDPQQYTEDQKKDSLWRGDNLYLRMKWRET